MRDKKKKREGNLTVVNHNTHATSLEVPPLGSSIDMKVGQFWPLHFYFLFD
jgi:hypothetical protein